MTDAACQTSRKWLNRPIPKKIKVIATDKGNTQMNIKVEDEKIEQVQEFIYLEAAINKDESSERGIRYRIGEASSVFAKPGLIKYGTLI